MRPDAERAGAEFAPWPHYDEDEVAAVAQVLRSGKVNYWTGDIARQFERDYAASIGRRHAIALANGTVALELALEAFDIGAGDEVIVPARTYVASASCAVMRGAVPVIADIDRDSQVVTAASLEAAITPRTRAIIVVHLAGWPCPMPEIMALARSRGIRVIEDCAQAHGARLDGRAAGSFGDAAAFSFCQDKIITTGGEGGLLALDDDRAWRRAWAFKDIGRSYEAAYEREHPVGFRWLTESFGTNWRMTEMQAAIGSIQLRKLSGWVSRRRDHARALRRALSRAGGLRIPEPSGDAWHACYRLYAFVEPEQLREGWDRDRIMSEIAAAGVPCSVGSCSEIYLEKAFVDRGWGPTQRLPIARELAQTSLAFLVHPTLAPAAISWTGEVASEVMRRACA